MPRTASCQRALRRHTRAHLPALGAPVTYLVPVVLGERVARTRLIGDGRHGRRHDDALDRARLLHGLEHVACAVDGGVHQVALLCVLYTSRRESSGREVPHERTGRACFSMREHIGRRHCALQQCTLRRLRCSAPEHIADTMQLCAALVRRGGGPEARVDADRRHRASPTTSMTMTWCHAMPALSSSACVPVGPLR